MTSIVTILCYISYHYVYAQTSLIVVFCSKLQRRNLRIVYDAIGTLAEAVGGELNQVCYFLLVIHCMVEQTSFFLKLNFSFFPKLLSWFIVIILSVVSKDISWPTVSLCFAACLSWHSHATINWEMAATFKFRQRSFSTPGMLYIYITCMHICFSNILHDNIWVEFVGTIYIIWNFCMDCNCIIISIFLFLMVFHFIQALGTGFTQFAEPVFRRCINIIQTQQFAKVLVTFALFMICLADYCITTYQKGLILRFYFIFQQVECHSISGWSCRHHRGSVWQGVDCMLSWFAFWTSRGSWQWDREFGTHPKFVFFRYEIMLLC